jgi:hypothetical protein
MSVAAGTELLNTAFSPVPAAAFEATGMSFTATTLTVELMASALVFTFAPVLRPLSSSLVIVTVLLPAVGAWLAFSYAMPLTSVCIEALDTPAGLLKLTVAVPATTFTE